LIGIAQDRRTGRSTRQIEGAPQNAIYIVPVSSTIGYYRDIAARVGRTDIRFASPTILSDRRYHGANPASIVVDHATWDMLTADVEDDFRGWAAVRLPGV
jgi:hypothetical protein